MAAQVGAAELRKWEAPDIGKPGRLGPVEGVRPTLRCWREARRGVEDAERHEVLYPGILHTG
jgi:hypothetical protein